MRRQESKAALTGKLRRSGMFVTLLGLALFSIATLMTAYSAGLGDLMIYRLLGDCRFAASG